MGSTARSRWLQQSTWMALDLLLVLEWWFSNSSQVFWKTVIPQCFVAQILFRSASKRLFSLASNVFTWVTNGFWYRFIFTWLTGPAKNMIFKFAFWNAQEELGRAPHHYICLRGEFSSKMDSILSESIFWPRPAAVGVSRPGHSNRRKITKSMISLLEHLFTKGTLK